MRATFVRPAVLTTMLLAGSGVAVAACAEVPSGSGCYYELVDGTLIAGSDECPGVLDLGWLLFGRGGPLPTTTTLPAPEPPISVPEPSVVSVESTSTTQVAPAGPTTTTTTEVAAATSTTAAPVGGFTATATCRPSPLGVVVAGTGVPGALVTISSATPYQWYYMQPSPPTVVAADGTWRFEMTAEVPSWIPLELTLTQSTGGTAVATLGAC